LRIALFCATARGERFLRELTSIANGAELTVITFQEEPWEPPFVDRIRGAAEDCSASFRKWTRAGVELFDDNGFDLLFAVNWRYHIPADIYKRARAGAFLFHDSLLPEYRGFSPTVWAIVNGEDHTGVSLIEMAEAIDEGDIVDQRRVVIGPEETIATVFVRVTDTYVDLLRLNFPAIAAGTARATPQDHALATYACKRLPEDNAIDWRAGTEPVLNLIRGVTRPYTGAFTSFLGQKLTVWSASHLPKHAPCYRGRVPGRVVAIQAEGVVVLTGDGAVLVSEVQAEGGLPVNAATMLTKLSFTLR
jgi:methionyl-tRNA formyltransferase